MRAGNDALQNLALPRGCRDNRGFARRDYSYLELLDAAVQIHSQMIEKLFAPSLG